MKKEEQKTLHPTTLYSKMNLHELTTLPSNINSIADQGESFFVQNYVLIKAWCYIVLSFFTFQKILFVDELLKREVKSELVFNKSTEETPMKDFQDTESMIQELENKKNAPLTFSYEERITAKQFFLSHNYYSFGIYRKLLPRREEKLYSFTECLTLYNFDDYLRENINKFTGIVELMFRATLVQQLCSCYKGNLHKGEFYLDHEIYKSERNANEVLTAFSKRMFSSKSDSAIHHIKNKDGCIPFWVIVEEATFGELYHFLTTLEPTYIDYWVTNSFDKQYKKHFPGWIRATNFMRNTCAHYSRIYGRYFNVSPSKLLKEDMKKAGIKADANKSLFANMLTIKNIIKFNPLVITEWNNFLEDIEVRISENKNLIKKYRMGFPENWRECLNISESYTSKP